MNLYHWEKLMLVTRYILGPASLGVLVYTRGQFTPLLIATVVLSIVWFIVFGLIVPLTALKCPGCRRAIQVQRGRNRYDYSCRQCGAHFASLGPRGRIKPV